jgi:hypothetical protein
MFIFQTSLHAAASTGKGDVIEILLRNGANVNEKDVRNTFVEETDDFEIPSHNFFFMLPW